MDHKETLVCLKKYTWRIYPYRKFNKTEFESNVIINILFIYGRGLFSVGNQISELLNNTEMAFGKGNPMSIEESKGNYPFKSSKGNFSTSSQKQ